MSIATHIEVYTDGGFDMKHDAIGSWAFLVRMPGQEVHETSYQTGGMKHTTNNRMEMMAVIEGLRALKRSCTVQVYTDSQYVQKGISAWIFAWKKKGRLAEDSANPVANQDLWRILDALAANHKVTWNWVRGHAGHPENERADELARKGLKEAAEARG